MNTGIHATQQATNRPSSSTENDYQRAIEHVVCLIEANLDKPLKLDELAAAVGFSPFHFHRIFAAFTGIPLSEYIRTIRLRRAAQRLIDSADNITEIALDAGYETPAAFSKAFKNHLYITPSQLRSLERDYAFAALHVLDPQKGKRRRRMKPEIRTLPDQQVLYVRRLGAEKQNFNKTAQLAFDALFQHIRQNNLQGKVNGCVAITPDEPGIVPEKECRFDAAVIINPGADVQASGEAQIQTLPGGRWAVFTHKGGYETLWMSWRAAYRNWVPNCGETLRDVAPYESYIDDPSTTRTEDLRTEILIPLV